MGNISIERGTTQIHYKVLLWQIWVNSDMHFGPTIISHAAYLTTTSTLTQPMFEYDYDLGLLQNAKAHGPEGTVKTIEKSTLQRVQVHYINVLQLKFQPGYMFASLSQRGHQGVGILIRAFESRGTCSQRLSC